MGICVYKENKSLRWRSEHLFVETASSGWFLNYPTERGNLKHGKFAQVST